MSELGQTRTSASATVRSAIPPVTDINDRLDERPLRADFVAKVFLRHGTQILRAIGATIE
jgi:hypothetical protein